jgi:hypothetical protein
MTNIELSKLLKEIITKIDTAEIDKDVLLEITKPLREVGITSRCYEGQGYLMSNKTENGFRLQLEWYGGQILNIVEKEVWWAMNACINVCDKFTTYYYENH